MRRMLPDPQRSGRRQPVSAESALTIRSDAGRKLSREQRRFNDLLDRVPELERAIAEERARLESLLATYHETLEPAHRKLAAREVALAHAVAAAAAELEIPERRKPSLRRMITDLCDVAASHLPLDEKTQALCEEWSEAAALDRRRSRRKRRGAQQAEAAAPEDEIERFFADAREKLGIDDDAGSRPHVNDAAPAAHELTRRSVRSVYLALAKVLHPDAVADPEEKSVREGFMKKAATAYGEGDLVTLLKLELQWVTTGDAAHSAASAAAVRSYVPALERQIAQLEAKRRAQADDDRFFDVRPFAALPEKLALAKMKSQAKAVKSWTSGIDDYRRRVLACRSKEELLELAADYVGATAGD